MPTASGQTQAADAPTRAANNKHAANKPNEWNAAHRYVFFCSFPFY
jgi:hypothetical protein